MLERGVSKARIGAFAIAVLLFVGVTGERASPQTAPQTDVARMEAAFQRGLVAARVQRWTDAIIAFNAASHPIADPGGDAPRKTRERILTPRDYSLRPEVWYNLGIVRSNVPHMEVRAIAAFKLYLMLSPAAPDAAQVNAQIAALERTFVANMSAVLDRAERAMPRNAASLCRRKKDDSRDPACPLGNLQSLFVSRVFLGQRDRAFAFSKRLGWSEREFYDFRGLDVGSYYIQLDEPTYQARRAFLSPGLANVEPAISPYVLFERGDWAGGSAIQFARSQSYANPTDVVGLACGARWFGDADGEKRAVDLIAAQTGYSDLYLATLMELGHVAQARVIAARATGSTQEGAQAILEQRPKSRDGRTYYRLQPCETPFANHDYSASVTWWGPGRAALLAGLAHADYPDIDGADLRAYITTMSNDLLLASPRKGEDAHYQWLFRLQRYAQTYRIVHGPFPAR